MLVFMSFTIQPMGVYVVRNLTKTMFLVSMSVCMCLVVQDKLSKQPMGRSFSAE